MKAFLEKIILASFFILCFKAFPVLALLTGEGSVEEKLSQRMVKGSDKLENITDQDEEIIFSALQRCPELTLKGNNFSEGVRNGIIRGLESPCEPGEAPNRTRVLYIEIPMGNEGAFYFAKVLRSEHFLKSLGFIETGIGDLGIRALLNTLNTPQTSLKLLAIDAKKSAPIVLEEETITILLEVLARADVNVQLEGFSVSKADDKRIRSYLDADAGRLFLE